MKKRILVRYIDTSIYEGGKIPDTLIHLNGVSYYIHSYTTPNSDGHVYAVLKVWKPF